MYNKLYNGLELPMMAFGPSSLNHILYPVEAKRINKWNLPGRAIRKFITGPLEHRAFTENYITSIEYALRVGFRLIDFSAAYGDGRLINEAIRRSCIAREEIFLTGRISNRSQFGGKAKVREEIDKILEGYETDCLDLLMFHWPVTGCYEDTWREICYAYDSGKTRSIGVANCHPHHIERLIKCGLKPMLNQFEIHPLFTQKDLVNYNRDLNIVIESYTPLARKDHRLFRLPVLNTIAKEYNKTPAQVVLRWHVQNGYIPIVRSRNIGRIKENFGIFDFELTREEMDKIDAININARVRYDPDNCDFTIL